MKIIVVSLAVLACVLPASGLAQERLSVRIPRVSAAPVIGDYLDGGTVPPGAKVSGFRQREPGDGTEASVETDVYVSYDDKHLYAVYICRDDPAKVRANLTKRESILGDDLVGLILDTYNDGRRAYMFLVNPMGIQMDGVTAEGQHDDYSYDTVWMSEGRRTSFGFVILMAVPFKSLRFGNDAVQTWGVAFGPMVPRANETSFWPFITRRVSGMVKQLARLEGLEGISPGRNLLAIPYGNFAGDRVLGERGYESDRSARIGVDVKAVVKDTVTVDATLNPDFSQVESDEPQVTINQRFEVFFPEKRPFFIENASYFETPVNLFFSRRVADPRLGGRVTGKAGGWAFGAIVANDEAPGRRVTEEDSRHNRMAGVAVLRAQRDFARQSHVGAIVTDREWGSTSNRVFGVDGRWKINDNWVLVGQGVGSRNEASDGHAVSGSVATAELHREGRGFDYSLTYLQVSPDFRSDLGYVRRRDIREAETEFDYTWHPQQSRVLSVGAGGEFGAIWDYAGALQEWTIEPGVEIELAGQTEIGARHWNIFERFDGQEFRRHRTAAWVSTEWLSWLNVSASADAGTAVNYYPAGDQAAFLADARSAKLSVTLKPLSRLRVDQSYLYARMQTRADGAAGCGCALSGTIFSNHILRTRANFQFSRALSVRAIADYEAILPTETLVDLEREKRLGVDVLVTYMVNPWTAVYLGYTDRYENWILGTPLERPVARDSGARTSVGRQVFVKVSYLLRY
ncbi:MAG: DUF5916 domain-containing protein [Vicinamibacterales bacterium]|nr:DUF5916 domain-containing protein [Vicinamibacterales bacterium]